MYLYIKNMVCNRCIMIVRQLLEQAGLQPVAIRLGEVEINKEPTKGQLSKLSENLTQVGFELLDDKKQQLIEKIKNIIVEQVHYSEMDEPLKFSELLSKQTHKDYSYLSNLFSEVEGTTIEKYLINQKIEMVKELLVYDELSLSEIAFKLGYSSVAHLSAQFKKVTGLTPGHFKKLKANSRKPLDEV
ncbi:MAG: helix-turn-helix domain-containing protein [Chitinophagaceae bacterium]